jgi:hypothetical protein
MDNTLQDLYDEAERLLETGMYAKSEQKSRELIRLAKQRGDNVALADGYMMLAACLERLKKVIALRDSREVALTHFFALFFFHSSKRFWLCATRPSLSSCMCSAINLNGWLSFSTTDPGRFVA